MAMILLENQVIQRTLNKQNAHTERKKMQILQQ